jgi:hypothetical protein
LPVIPPPKRRLPNVTLSTRIDSNLRDLLDEYCRFALCGRRHVVSESLRRTFEQDPEFRKWRENEALAAGGEKPAKATFA